MPVVSIIIPTKDRAALLMQTLASVRAQTFADFEAIVVDDHSADDTLLRLQQIALEDPRIRYTHVPRPRFGAQAARNVGVEASAGEYVIFLDSDDLLAPHCLQQRVDAMRADPSLDFAVFPCRCFRQSAGDHPSLWNVATNENDLDRFLKIDVPWQTTSPVWKRSSLTGLLPWPEDVPVGQDWEFHIRALLLNLKYAFAGTVDHHWRMPQSERESIGKNYLKPELLKSRVRVNERVLQSVTQAGALTDARRDMFAGLFFQSTERIGTRAGWRDGLAVWKRALALKLITPTQFMQGRRYMWLYRFKKLRASYRAHLQRVWPVAFFVPRSPTYLFAPASDAAPRVSVVISAYNAQRYLREAIDSILTQTFGDFECVIVNDGSSDDTLSILKSYAQRDPRIRIISRANKGLTVSLNEALAACRAPLVARMDADDVALPERFAKQVAFMDANPDVVVVACSVELIDPFGIHIGIVNYPTDHASIDTQLLKGDGGCICHPGCVYRLDAVRRVGNYRQEFNNSEDLDLWLRLAETGRVANLPDVLLKYRRDLGSVSHTKRDNQLRMKSTIVGQAFARRGLTPPKTWTFDAWQPKPPHEQLALWGWRALKLGRLDAARGHAKALMKLKPLSPTSWRLLLCAARGR